VNAGGRTKKALRERLEVGNAIVWVSGINGNGKQMREA